MKKIFIGEYTEKDLKNGTDKKDVEAAKDKTGLQYVITEITKKPSLKIWLSDDFSL